MKFMNIKKLKKQQYTIFINNCNNIDKRQHGL